MANTIYAGGKYSLGICDRCGMRYKLNQLIFESMAAKGTPTNEISNLRVCPRCYDPPHPQAFLPIVAQATLPDPEQLWKPRPDIFPKAYPVSFSFPGQLYANIPAQNTLGTIETGLPIHRPSTNTTIVLNVSGTLLPLSISATATGGIIVQSISATSPVSGIISIVVGPSTALGTQQITVTTIAPGNFISNAVGLVNIITP